MREATVGEAAAVGVSEGEDVGVGVGAAPVVGGGCAPHSHGRQCIGDPTAPLLQTALHPQCGVPQGHSHMPRG